MGGGSAPTVSAPRADYVKDIKKYVDALGQSMPTVLTMEQTYRPQFGQLNMNDISNMFSGQNGQPGLQSLAGQAGQAGMEQTGAARATSFGQMQAQTPAVRGLFQGLDPVAAAQVEQSAAAANRAWNASQSLTPEEARNAQQAARESYSDRGRVMDNSAVGAEILNRESVLAGKRQEAQQAGTNAYNLSQNFYSAPGLQALSGVPAGYMAGQNILGQSMGAVGMNTPQLIDVGQGLNLGAAQRQNILNAQMANAQAAGAASAGQGSMIGAGIGAVGTIAAAGIMI